MATQAKMIKICLTNRGEDSETPWAEDMGPAPGPDGSRMVKLVNVPFLHAKPTWGDVIVVSPVDDGFLTWDRNNVWWKQVPDRIEHDGGRWAMIVDYAPRDGDTKGTKAFDALAKACEPADVVCEGAWGPRGNEPGRAYLAVRNEVTADSVMATLRAAKLPCELIQIHPELKTGKGSGAMKKPAIAKPATATAKAAAPAASKSGAMAKPGAKSAAPAPVAKSVPVAKASAAKSGSMTAKSAAAKSGSMPAPTAKSAAAKSGSMPAPTAKSAAAKSGSMTAPTAKSSSTKAKPPIAAKTASKPVAKPAAKAQPKKAGAKATKKSR